MDEDGTPLPGVCVVIGPRGCQPHSPRTDDRGVYYVDLPQNPSILYEFQFQKDGYGMREHKVRPRAPTTFDVVMRRL